MATIKAVDGAELSINGGALKLPLPVGTTVNIHHGGIVNSGAEINGNTTATILQKKTTGIMKGLVLRIADTDDLAAFQELCSKQEISFILDNGDTSYRIASGAIMSPSEDASIGYDSATLKTEAFDIRCQKGKIETL